MIRPLESTSIGRAAKASRDRKDVLEDMLLELSCIEANRSLEGIAVGLVATVDLLNDIYYAPVTNVGRGHLQEAFSAVSTTGSEVLELIRNQFPLKFAEDGVLRDLLKQQAEYNPDDALLLRVDLRNGLVKLAAVVGRPGTLSDSKVDMTGIGADESRRITPEVLGYLKRIRRVLLSDSDLAERLLIVFRPRMFGGPASASLPLSMFCQVGFLLCPDGTDMARLGAATWPLLTTSAHVALNVLFERERYYERSVRQCALGYMVKCGPAGELNKQFKQLQELGGDSAEITVDVLVPDPMIDRPEVAAMSWYTMNRFRLSSLSKLFTGVGNIEPYEVRAVTRAAISHLQRAYWEREGGYNEGTISATARTVLAGPWAVADLAADALYREVRECVEIARSGVPIRSSEHSISFVLSDQARPLSELKRFVEGDAAFGWVLESPSRSSFLRGVHARQALHEIKEAILASDKTKMSVTKYDTYRIHGDAHFDNFLLDASVPEHPVIVSIDPQWPTEWDKTIRGKVDPFGSPEDDRDAVLACLMRDRTYDYAKLLLATILGYGMIYRKGLSYGVVQRRYQAASMKVCGQSPRVIPLSSDSGGISVASLYRLEAPMCSEAPQYHLWSGLVVLQHFIEYLKASQQSGRSATATVIRLWLLTVRHGLSIAAKCLPGRIEVSWAMYGCVCGFIGIGLNEVLDAIRNELDVDAIALARRILRSPLASAMM